MRSTRILTVVSLGLALVLAGCADASDDSVRTSTSGEEFNSADVTFATEMIQHHAQALKMVDLTMGRDLSAEVQQLADDVRAAQTPEIEQMSDWLQDWDEPIPSTVRDHANSEGDMGDMDMSEMDDMPGMMSPEEMESLEKAPDAEFEQMWLEMMITHHEGAAEMAAEEQEDGLHQGAVKLAEQIEAAQTEEIQTMEGLLQN